MNHQENSDNKIQRNHRKSQPQHLHKLWCLPHDDNHLPTRLIGRDLWEKPVEASQFLDITNDDDSRDEEKKAKWSRKNLRGNVFQTYLKMRFKIQLEQRKISVTVVLQIIPETIANTEMSDVAYWALTAI